MGIAVLLTAFAVCVAIYAIRKWLESVPRSGADKEMTPIWQGGRRRQPPAVSQRRGPSDKVPPVIPVCITPRDDAESEQCSILRRRLRLMLLGDDEKLQRLIELERERLPDRRMVDWLRAAIVRLERDNR